MKSELTAVSDAPLLPCIKGLFEDVAAEAEFWLLSGQKKKKSRTFLSHLGNKSWACH